MARTNEVMRDARVGEAEAKMATEVCKISRTFFHYRLVIFLNSSDLCINKLQIAQAEAELQRMEAKLKNETGVAKAQRDFNVKKGII